MVVFSVSELLPGVESGVEEVTEAVLEMGLVAEAVTFTVSVTVVLPLAAIVPRVQVTVGTGVAL
jgi:hypothetical protein